MTLSAPSLKQPGWEAWLALYHGRPLTIAKAARGAARRPRFAPTDASRRAQEAYLAWLKDYKRYSCKFTSPGNLASHIAYSAILDRLAGDTAAKASQRALEIASRAKSALRAPRCRRPLPALRPIKIGPSQGRESLCRGDLQTMVYRF